MRPTVINLLLLVVVACSSSGPNSPNEPPSGGTVPPGGDPPGGGDGKAPPPNTFQMSALAFLPASLTVPVGTTVKWENNSAVPHTVSPERSSPWGHVTLDPGDELSVQLNTPGTYPFSCQIHVGMNGTLIVQ